MIKAALLTYAYLSARLVLLLTLFAVLGPAFAAADFLNDGRVEPPAAALKYRADVIRNVRIIWGINGPVATIAGQLRQESAWKANAKSRTGAQGLAQFMPQTAAWIATVYTLELGNEYTDESPLNPTWALRAIARYDKHLFDRVKRYETGCDRLLFALSDYNGGSGWRIKRQDRSPRPGSYAETAFLNPGIGVANQRENEEYALRIVYHWQPDYRSWGPGACS